jgi:hypothetical protein
MSSKLRQFFLFIGIALFCLGLCGCTRYTTPGGPAKMSIFTDVPKEGMITTTKGGDFRVPAPEQTDIEIEHREPLANFPANIVYVRVQEPGYKSYTTEGKGIGAFSVVFARDVEKDEDWEGLNRLVDVAQVGPLSRLLVPEYLQNEKDLRTAAARLNADMLMIYTLDTSFMDRDTSAGLTVITLGLGPTINVRVTCTVSALLLDTRSGYTYGAVEETAVVEKNTSALSSKNAMDNMRLGVERQAFEQFIDEYELLWKNVAQQYSNK